MSKSAKLSFELVVIVFGLSVAVLMLAVSRVQAAAVAKTLNSVPHEQHAMPIPDGVPSSTPAPMTTPAPNPVRTILNVISFDATGSLLKAWTSVMQKAQEKAVEEMRPALEAAHSGNTFAIVDVRVGVDDLSPMSVKYIKSAAKRSRAPHQSNSGRAG